MRQPHTLTIETAPWKHDQWIAPKDFVTTGKLFGCLLAALAPSRYWPAASRLMARIHLRIRGASIRLLEGPGLLLGLDASALVHDYVAADYLVGIQAIRDILPGGWQSETSLIGRTALDRALQQSRGAILWTSSFVGSGFIARKALARAGYPLTLLSSPFHPFSTTYIGTRLLNPVRLRAENRYLVRRVRFVYGNAKPALAALGEVLSENGVVVIMAIGTGRKTLAFPFLGGTIDLAVGAPMLAYETGAALIPVFTLPDQEAGYRVELGPDLNHSPQLSEDRALLDMASRYVTLLEPIVRAYPACWEGWFHPATWRSSA